MSMPRSIHDKLTIIQVINYRKHGYTDIKVNYSNYLQGKPDQVGGYTPDLSAVSNYKTIICKVETNASINENFSIQQWKAFSKSNYEFHLIVPKSVLNDVKEIAKMNGVTVDKYWYSESC